MATLNDFTPELSFKFVEDVQVHQIDAVNVMFGCPT